MTALHVAIAGIGVWSPRFADWPALRLAFDEPTGAGSVAQPVRRPVPLLLPAAERRRVPDGVAVALEVAREALAAAAGACPIDAATLASVFASAHGELAIVDYLCSTLATDPLGLSPTRFHHSVHNAAAGYWGIATSSVGPSTSIAAGDDSFALGLVEAATQVAVDGRPVLLVVFDTPAVGLLTAAVANTALFGAALLLTPPRGDGSTAHLSIALDDLQPVVGSSFDAGIGPLASLAASSPAARALLLLEAIARDVDTTVDYPMTAAPTMRVDVRRADRSGADRVET